MNSVLSSRHPGQRALTLPWPSIFVFWLVLLQSPLAQAQQPVASVSGSSTGTSTTISPSTYNTLRTPSITLTIGTLAKGSLTDRPTNAGALAAGESRSGGTGLIQPQSRNGVFDEVTLGYLDGSGKAPVPVNVSLRFDTSHAGAAVWVQPLDGGAILTQDANGKPVSNPGGCKVVLDASGQLVFSYQALAVPGRYQVLIRLDNVSSILPFIIPDPKQAN